MNEETTANAAEKADRERETNVEDEKTECGLTRAELRKIVAEMIG